jgi:hypothetical protein
MPHRKRNYDGLFMPGTDYKATFKKIVDEVEEINLPLYLRIREVKRLIDAYCVQTGERPDGQQLYRLANYLLADDLSDPCQDKVARKEFPFLSLAQQKTRSRREPLFEPEIVGKIKARKVKNWK